MLLSILRWVRPSLWFLAVVTTGVMFDVPAVGQETPAEYLPAITVAQKALAAKSVVRTGVVGAWPTIGDSYTRTWTSGGVLVGLHVGVGKWDGKEQVYALKPVYQTADYRVVGDEVGIFEDTLAPERDDTPAGRGPRVRELLKSSVKETVYLTAKPGYAVAALQVRPSGAGFKSLRLTFARVRGTRLDSSDAYMSAWVGTPPDEDEPKGDMISSDGRLVVGLFGKYHRVRQVPTWVNTVGFVCMTSGLDLREAVYPRGRVALKTTPPVPRRAPRKATAPPESGTLQSQENRSPRDLPSPLAAAASSSVTTQTSVLS